ncbi:MAG: ATP-dependent DNA helicase [Thermomicrobiales bacterium]
MKPVSEIVDQVLGPEGMLSRMLPGFETRPDQVAMAQQVAVAFAETGTLLAEAGTGIGKSLAYLIPAAYWSIAEDEAVIVSTHTRALQEQLIYKDVPVVRQVMNEILPRRALKAMSLKGRSNYLCRERFLTESASRTPDPEIAMLVAKMRAWVEITATGDKSELLLSEREDRQFERLSASTENCSNAVCRTKQGQKCFFARARSTAQRSDIVIVNHALLFSDQGSGGVLLPESTRLIIDEAHHLEAVATRQFSFTLTAAVLVKHVQSLIELRGASATGLLPTAVGMLANSGVVSSATNGSANALGRIRAAIQDGDRTARLISELFVHLETVDGGEGARVRTSTRGQPLWTEVEIIADQLLNDFQQLESHCQWLIKQLARAVNERKLAEPGEAALASAEAWMDTSLELAFQLRSSFLEPDENGVYWVERESKDVLALRAAPLAVGDWIAGTVLAEKETIVLTSATLTVGNRFTLLREQVGVTDATEFVAPSPFDYGSSALIYVASDIAEPTHVDYQDGVAEAIMRVAVALQGKTLALFTSNRHLRAAAEALREPLAQHNIELLAQWVDAPPQELAERLRDGGPVVVLGAASMWEGIDIPGPGLSALVVVRLPFDVPGDPLFQARSEQHLSPFFEYSVPRAVLRFRQGFGRLIRSSSDRGVCVVLDRRIITKAYGRAFLDALPDCQVERGPLTQTGSVARHWIERGAAHS